MIDLSGIWTCMIAGCETSVRIPGTLDESRIGFPDDPEQQWKRDDVCRIGFYQPGDPIVTRLTRKYAYEGPATLITNVSFKKPEGERIFVYVERARHLRLKVNGREASPVRPANISTPYCFEVTDLVTGEDQLEFLSDNSYPEWPRDAIVYSSAASNETQTNWNGLLGNVCLYTEQQIFVSDLRVYPRGEKLDICIEMDSALSWQGNCHISSDALESPAVIRMELQKGKQSIWIRDLEVARDAKKWDIDEGNLYTLSVSGDGFKAREACFGLREFVSQDGHLMLNGRRIFLRGETNCAVFPETGYPPMDESSWVEILNKYRAYGVNCVRFHSHCPPEAAFTAADKLGMLMQPELSHWDPEHAFHTQESKRYYKAEWMEILRAFANHPSFVMLTMGNELHADEAGHRFMDELIEKGRKYDSTRLYANGSNVHYGVLGTDPASDFYTAMMYYDWDVRATCDGPKGWLNHEYPDLRRNYDKTVNALRKVSAQPIFSFEVGQYEVLPDFGEIGDYRGVTAPENLRHIRKKVEEKGLGNHWNEMVSATGECSLLCYRAEVEAALRTEDYSGISLLSLQDFPGQGTALIGMMNAHLKAKPYAFARPERFAVFFREALPLVLLKRFTYAGGETLTATVQMANYGKTELSGTAQWSCVGEEIHADGSFSRCDAKCGGLTELGEIELEFPIVSHAQKLTLAVTFSGITNVYPIWVYPRVNPVCPPEVYECRSLDEKALRILDEGGTVYLAPDSTQEDIPNSVQAQFSPDFWSVCTFPEQSGTMGQLIESRHPIFSQFPTESYNNWQWWPMAVQRAMVLPERIECIIAEMDSYAFLRPMAKLFECRCGKGRLMVSSLNLHNLDYPESRALQQAIYDYLAGPAGALQSLSLSFIKSLFEKADG